MLLMLARGLIFAGAASLAAGVVTLGFGLLLA